MRSDDIWDSVMEATEPHEQRMRSFMRKNGIKCALEQDSQLSDLKFRLVKHFRGRVPAVDAIGIDGLLNSGLIWVTFQNQLKDIFRRRRRAPDYLPLDLPITDRNDGVSDLQSKISSALQNLPDSDARLVRQVFLERQSQVDLALQLGKSCGTISRRLQRILQTLSNSPELKSVVDV